MVYLVFFNTLLKCYESMDLIKDTLAEQKAALGLG